MSSSAVKSALDVNAKVIVVLSESGRMANYISKFRPGVSVLMMTPNEQAARQASGILAGLHSVAVDKLDKAENFEVVAVCDVNQINLDKALEMAKTQEGVEVRVGGIEARPLA